MRDTIDNVRDVTYHATKMAFFVEYHGEQQISQSKATEGSGVSYTRPWLIRILGEIRHYSRVKPEIKYTLFQRERAIFIPCSRVREAKRIPC